MAAVVARETRGEIVRWTGMPHAGRVLRRAFAVYAIAIPWCAVTFTVFGVLFASALSGKPPPRPVPLWEQGMMLAAIVFAFAFVALGIALLATPLWAWRKARRTVYVVTDRRVVSIIMDGTMTVAAVPRGRIVKLVRRERRDGTGTLRIVTGYEKDSDGDTTETAFEVCEVADVAGAEKAARALVAAAGDRDA